MTTITFGGGPTIDARRNFSNLKPGSEVPGYRGYIHQLKYNAGHTYGDQTHLLADKFPQLKRHHSSLDFGTIGSSLSKGDSLKPILIKNNLPRANGVNRLTESMVPGYTGYIPSRKFQFSNTYKNECDQCIDDFVDQKKEKLNKDMDIVRTVYTQPKHTAISVDSDLAEKMAVKNNEQFAYHQSDKRTTTEPPMPGYTGHIPKIHPTDLGLGARFHTTTERGLRQFDSEYRRYKSAANPNFKSVQFTGTTGDEYLDVSKPSTGKRVYIKPGMIPNYTGYVHGRKFEFGSTYGETTRDLPVCSHDTSNFGTYMQTHNTKTFIC